MMTYFAIFLGGGFGSLCRFFLSRWNGLAGWMLPLGTIAANILSCIVLGFVVGYWSQKPDYAPTLRAFFAIGFCGGFSTFSTFSLETFQLLKTGSASYAFLNIGISMIACLAALYMGFVLAKS